MKINREARRTARDLFQLSLVAGKVDAGRASEISRRLVEEKPRNFLQILKEYSRLVRLELEKRRAVVESAVPVEEGDRQRIENSLQERFGRDITAEFRTSPHLLGGLRVKLGSDVWDGSVSGRLSLLSKQL